MSDVISIFQRHLSVELIKRGLQVRLWPGANRTSRNLLKIFAVPKPTVLYVKASNTTPGFWGLTKNQIDRLQKLSVRWFTVFLHGGSNSGYLLSGNEVGTQIKRGMLTLSDDGDYKLNEKQELQSAVKFDDLGDLVSQVL
ncbi:MAG: hypothetical protein WD823_04860 [Sulfuricaulis sp.]|uniref:hypothetical protein n=1 Tax=Sulfuricaulis sp. TaxID=2003553 RepID=UPI0034A45191